MPALAVWTPEDGLLGALAPLGLATAAPGPALVVDLDEHGPRYPGEGSLAGLVEDGPRLDDLHPAHSGTAVLRNGGVTAEAAAGVVDALIGGWGHVVLRLPPRRRLALSVPVVPVRLLLPGSLFAAGDGPAVYQATPARVPMRVAGVRLPVPGRSTVAGLTQGRVPPAGDRWVRSWRKVWEVPWGR